MKRFRISALLYGIAVLCLLSACGKQAETAETAWSEAQMAQAIWTSQERMDGQVLLYGDEDFSRYVSDFYAVSPEELAGGAVLYAGGVSAQEIAVLRLTDAEAAGRAEAALERYIDSRAGDFAGYAPEQYAIAEHSAAASRGAWAALLICPDRQAALDAFAACFTSEPPEEGPPGAVPAGQTVSPAETEPEEGPLPPPLEIPEEQNAPEERDEPPAPPPDEGGEPSRDQPEQEPEPGTDPDTGPAPEPAAPEGPWSYDRERIVNAWTSGDRDGLWEQDLAILEVLDGIPALADETLTDYARELALHDWMLAWAEYDPGALSSGPRGDPMPDNDNPYGFLTGKKGVCLGYTATFQLLMDLAGIECISVSGMAHAGTEEHAWNLVKLDGGWYAVDTTWDDPVTSRPVSQSMAHRYFNVTSEYLRRHDHQWDGSAVPEAEGTALAWTP